MPLPKADSQIGLEEHVEPEDSVRFNEVMEAIKNIEDARDPARAAGSKLRKAQKRLTELVSRGEVEGKRLRFGPFVIDGASVQRYIPGPGEREERFQYKLGRL